MNSSEPGHSRRDFLTGKAVRNQAEYAGAELLSGLAAGDSNRLIPVGGSTVRLATRAMGCDFSVFLNPAPDQRLAPASDALELLHPLEQMMTVYRSDSDLSLINQRAHEQPVDVGRELFGLLLRCRELSIQTFAAFDPTSGPLIRLWKQCRDEQRIPEQTEIDECLRRVGMSHVVFDERLQQIQFDRIGVELNLGAIGKGFALDCCRRHLLEEGIEDFLLHGGHSSITAWGTHAGEPGWPIGLRNPLFTEERYATILLRDRAMSTSGSNIQYFRHAGRRWGHILDPRTGWPADPLLSCSVIAPTAEQADALSTAFFVGGVENAQRYCDNHGEVQALLIPHPQRGRRLEPINCGIPEDVLFLHSRD